MTIDDTGPAASQAWQALLTWTAGDVAAARAQARAAVAAARGRPRRERQQVQIIQLALAGETGRATGLIAEHLAEFPADALVGRVLAKISGPEMIT
jgi:hypothetical protein